MKQHNIELCFIFDGHKHLMKSKTHEELRETRLKSKSALLEFYRKGKDTVVQLQDADHVEAMKNIKL